MVTPPSNLLSSSSLRTASWRCLGIMRLRLLSRAALPASSRISAHRYSRTAAIYTGAPPPRRGARRCWRMYRPIRPTGNCRPARAERVVDFDAFARPEEPLPPFPLPDPFPDMLLIISTLEKNKWLRCQNLKIDKIASANQNTAKGRSESKSRVNVYHNYVHPMGETLDFLLCSFSRASFVMSRGRFSPHWLLAVGIIFFFSNANMYRTCKIQRHSIFWLLMVHINFPAQLNNKAKAQATKNCSQTRYILQFNTYLHLEDRKTYIKQVLGLPAYSSGCNYSKKNESANFEGTDIGQLTLNCVWVVARQRNLVTKMNLPSDFSVISLARQTHHANRPSAVLALLRKRFESAKLRSTVKSIWVRDVVSDMRVSTINIARKILQARSHKRRRGQPKPKHDCNPKPHAKLCCNRVWTLNSIPTVMLPLQTCLWWARRGADFRGEGIMEGNDWGCQWC